MTVSRGRATAACVCLLLISFPAFTATKTHGYDPLCGPKSLLTICKQLRIHATLDEITRLCGIGGNAASPEDVSILDLYHAAKQKGLAAAGMKIAPQELLRLRCPAIAHLWDQHFVVVQTGGPGMVKVTDPAGESTAIPIDEFAESYSGFALLVSDNPRLFPVSEFSGPDLRLEQYTHDFGFVEIGSQVAHTVKCSNKGNGDLVVLGIDSSCPCTTGLIFPEVIPPGGDAELRMAFDTTGREGFQRQILYIHCSDPVTSVVEFHLIGVVKPPRVNVSPWRVNFGVVKRGENASREIYVADPGDGSLQVTKVSTNTYMLTTELAPSRDKERPGTIVGIRLARRVPLADFKGRVRIHTNHPKAPVVDVPVTATVVGDIKLSPDMLFFGLQGKGRPIKKTISIRSSAEDPLRIERIDNPFDYISVKIKAERDEYRLIATLADDAPKGYIQGRIIIHTNDRDEPEIGIPVYALVEE